MTSMIRRSNGNGNMPGTSLTGVFDKFFNDGFTRFFDHDLIGAGRLTQSAGVPVNVRDNDTSYEIELVAPGLRKEDFHVSMNGDMLTVSFEHKEENNRESKEEGWLRKEYRRQSFSRSFNLDDTVDANRITARYNDGILHLSLPKKEDAQRISRMINIE